jgi:hypothetical protein
MCVQQLADGAVQRLLCCTCMAVVPVTAPTCELLPVSLIGRLGPGRPPRLARHQRILARVEAVAATAAAPAALAHGLPDADGFQVAALQLLQPCCPPLRLPMQPCNRPAGPRSASGAALGRGQAAEQAGGRLVDGPRKRAQARGSRQSKLMHDNIASMQKTCALTNGNCIGTAAQMNTPGIKPVCISHTKEQAANKTAHHASSTRTKACDGASVNRQPAAKAATWAAVGLEAHRCISSLAILLTAHF